MLVSFLIMSTSVLLNFILEFLCTCVKVGGKLTLPVVVKQAYNDVRGRDISRMSPGRLWVVL